MKTCDLVKPKVGMTLFSEEALLMVEVLSITDAGFDFYVLNGLWSGGVRDNQVVMYNVPTGERSSAAVKPYRGGYECDFVQVLEVTRDEYDHWYMENGGSSAVPVRDGPSVHIKADPDAEVEVDAEVEEPAGRILRAQIEKGLSTEALEAESRTFIEKKGLSSEYANHLEALTFEEEFDEDMEP